MVTPIEDYAIIGNGRSAALISPQGNMDWLCLPNLDSSACFAALLGTEDHGRWSLTVSSAHVAKRWYEPETFILCTEYSSAMGGAIVQEWMPPNATTIIRSVRCTWGQITVEETLRVRFDYGSIIPWAKREQHPGNHQVLKFVAGPEALTYASDRLPFGYDQQHVKSTPLVSGESYSVSLTWNRSWQLTPPAPDVIESLSATRTQWQQWCSGGDFGDDFDTHVRRSLLTLRLLTNVDTGGIAAAATTSLPEDFGGIRNWDYRFCWLRDSALTLNALLDFDFVDEAHEWRQWLLRAVAGDPADVQIMYGLDGRRRLQEISLDHLPGYAESSPVRVGNAASNQVQHDVFGEVLGALSHAREAGVQETVDSWSLQTHLVQQVLSSWHEPDHGIWEIRGPRRHFTQSKIMCWFALDRMIEGVERFGLPGPVETWREVRGQIRADVLAHGVDETSGSLVQHYDTTEVDASLLMILRTGFLPTNDHRVVATVQRIRDELSTGVHVKRYRTDSGVDGLDGKEHHFYACSFWLVEALAHIGLHQEALQRFEALLTTCNEVGLLAEEYDVVNNRFAGNFPQALSHLGLVQAARTLRAHRSI